VHTQQQFVFIFFTKPRTSKRLKLDSLLFDKLAVASNLKTQLFSQHLIIIMLLLNVLLSPHVCSPLIMLHD